MWWAWEPEPGVPVSALSPKVITQEAELKATFGGHSFTVKSWAALVAMLEKEKSPAASMVRDVAVRSVSE